MTEKLLKDVHDTKSVKISYPGQHFDLVPEVGFAERQPSAFGNEMGH
ncbi:hypothetical protein MNBD_GAMMA12-2477 [hydrothermal vent metagenome]|uniref:Uncharacterized protein n=1 Tax=hydrothermal vent metagenome TaxID=652676 RepID=A0A3B0YRX7_9ZZZZ